MKSIFLDTVQLCDVCNWDCEDLRPIVKEFTNEIYHRSIQSGVGRKIIDIDVVNWLFYETIKKMVSVDAEYYQIGSFVKLFARYYDLALSVGSQLSPKE